MAEPVATSVSVPTEPGAAVPLPPADAVADTMPPLDYSDDETQVSEPPAGDEAKAASVPAPALPKLTPPQEFKLVPPFRHPYFDPPTLWNRCIV
jgi:hypothetical protein